MVNNKTILCTVHYNSTFPIERKVAGLSADDLVWATKLIFTKYGLPKKIISDPGMNVTSEMFKVICKMMNIQQSITPSYNHHSNGQVEACIKFVKCTITKCIDTDQDISLAL